ncbi:aldehyde dehydrogenase family protein [Agromyces neolithicus]|uniref:Gamma-aminobutyraldehyde dehydrogenase n=1 Tax=Agromyces neolithicus TaxID=269420 RepID=A0ABP4YPT1_9MICO
MSTVSTPTIPALRHLIAGESVAGSGEYAVVDPSTGAQIAVQPVATSAEVDAAVAAAKGAFVSWRRTTAAERSGYLLSLADAIDASAEEFSALESLDVGKPISTARAELPGISDTLRYYAGAARVPHGTSSGSYASGMHSRVEREPVGVVGLITPWNYPLLEAVWKIAPALAAGNTLVLKPSELTPLTTVRLFELASGILPTGVVNVVLGDASTGRELVAHTEVSMISITGDVGTGKAVAASAAQTLKRVHLELGGKAPVLVLPDTDLSTTVEFLVSAGLVNSGQDCTAACRVIVHDAIYDEFVDRYVAAAAAVVPGIGLDEATTMGPLVSERQRERVLGFIDRARSAGAQVAVGGDAPSQPGSFVNPTVILGAEQGSEIIQSEVFGPVTTIQRGASEAAMVEWANDTRYGLSAGVWTDDLNASQRVTRALNFGTVWINTHLWTFPETPFGGFDGSGYGKELSPMSIDDYSRFKHVLLQER